MRTARVLSFCLLPSSCLACAAAEPEAAEPVAEPEAAEPVAEPEAAEPVAEPEAAEPVAEPEAAEPVAEPEVETAEEPAAEPAAEVIINLKPSLCYCAHGCTDNLATALPHKSGKVLQLNW